MRSTTKQWNFYQKLHRIMKTLSKNVGKYYVKSNFSCIGCQTVVSPINNISRVIYAFTAFDAFIIHYDIQNYIFL